MAYSNNNNSKLAAGTVMLLFLGLLLSWSIFRAPLMALFPGWSLTQVSMTFTLSLAFYCIGGFVSGRLTLRIPHRYVIRVSAAMILAGLGLVSFSLDPAAETRSLYLLYVFYGVVGGCGIGLSYNSILSCVNRWFPGRAGMASGVQLLGFGIGGLALGNIANLLTGLVGVIPVFAITGAMLAAVLFAFSFVIKAPEAPEADAGAATAAGGCDDLATVSAGQDGLVPSTDVAREDPAAMAATAALGRDEPAPGAATATGGRDEPAAATATATAGQDEPATRAATTAPGRDEPAPATAGYTLAEMLRTKAFWLFFIWTVATAAGAMLVINSAAPIAAYYGAPAVLGLIVSVFNGVGRPVTGLLHDRIGRPKALVVETLFLIFGGLTLLFGAVFTRVALIFIGLSLTGIASGGSPALVAAGAMSFFGGRNYSVNVAVVTFGVLPAAIIGPLISSKLLESSGGSYLPAFIMLIAIGLASLGVTLVLNAVSKQPAK